MGKAKKGGKSEQWRKEQANWTRKAPVPVGKKKKKAKRKQKSVQEAVSGAAAVIAGLEVESGCPDPQEVIQEVLDLFGTASVSHSQAGAPPMRWFLESDYQRLERMIATLV